MLSQIQKGNLELRQYRDNLEQLVEERTEKLKTAQKELVQKERLALLGELSAKVAHELRNPLGTIRNVIFSISYSVPKIDENSHNLLEMVERNIVRCNNIIEELLDFARPHSPKKEWVQIDKFLGEIINEQKLDSDFSIQESFDSKVSVLIYKERLRRAIINVIENALQALSEKKSQTGKKGEKVSGLNLNINANLDSNILEINFIDTALGIPDEEFNNIFTPLYSTKSFGVGLGLPIAKEIMNQHQGGVEISSKENEGSTVKLWLPIFVKD
jgi:signal transduction histidine kinase